MSEYEQIATLLPKFADEFEGTIGKPELKVITSGTKTGTSLNFYVQINNTVYKYLVHQGSATPERVTLICERGNNKIPKDKRCPHRIHLIILNPDVIESKESIRAGKKRPDGRGFSG